MLKQGDSMHIDADFMNCVGFVGKLTVQGFDADGTCFVVSLEEEDELFIYCVTARHLVRPTKFRREMFPTTEPIYVRLPQKDRAGIVVPNTRGDWMPHSDVHVDLCVAEFDKTMEVRGMAQDAEASLTPLALPKIALSKELAGYFGFGLGSEIFIPSVFVGHEGELSNTPIVRFGNIAAMPTVPVRYASPTRPAFLIETHSLGGTSGAPVFFHTDPYRRFRRVEARRDPNNPKKRSVPYFLIGMVLGSHSGTYLTDFVVNESADQIIAHDAEFNAGISVVVPVDAILELAE
jgi:hypothetical protein